MQINHQYLHFIHLQDKRLHLVKNKSVYQPPIVRPSAPTRQPYPPKYYQTCSGWICRRYITKITGAYGRWKIIIFTTHLFNARKASLSSRVTFFKRMWNPVGVSQTSYSTHPTQNYTFQLNVWARGCPVVRWLSYRSRF
jgi:hypothetical protein